MRTKKKIIYTAVALFVLYSSWTSGVITILKKGMAGVAYNTKKYYFLHHEIDGSFSLEIDLSDPDSNTGKELYNDDGHKIIVERVYQGGLNTGGYIIVFRSKGKYSPAGGSLVSGIKHEYKHTNHGFSSEIFASMTAEYRGKVYQSFRCGQSGIIYKDGDTFSFYLFPREAYDKQEITLNESGIAVIHIRHLCKTIWTKV